MYQPELDLTVCAWFERSGFVSEVIRLRSFSPSSSAWHPGRSASGFCRSTSGLDAVSPHCIHEPINRDRPAARRLNDTPFCGTRYGRTRSARSCGSVRRYRWSAGSWFWCASDRCARPRGGARTHAAPGCHNTRGAKPHFDAYSTTQLPAGSKVT